MSTLTEPVRTGEFVLSLANGERSKEAITVKLAEVLVAGQVLAKQTTAAIASAAALAGNTGNGVMGTVTASALARKGQYRLIVLEKNTDAGQFEVFDPGGVSIGKGTIGSAFSAGGLAFTLADGGTDFVAGDGFVITVTAVTEVYIALPNDGSVPAEGICWDAYDATSAAVAGVAVVRDAEVNDHLLTWPTGISTANKDLAKTQLAALGIIVR